MILLVPQIASLQMRLDLDLYRLKLIVLCMIVEADSPVITEDDRLIATIESSRWWPTKSELCIWICCSFYENLCIPVADLVMYGMCLNMFENVHDMVGARDRVHGLIETMNRTMREILSETLDDIFGMDDHDVITLNDEEFNSEYVKMPDSVYRAALVISERYSSLLQGNREMRRWNEPERYTNCYVLSLVLQRISVHPVNWEFPKLGILRLTYGKDSQSLPDDFFERMKELRILTLNVPSLPQLLNVLRNLQTLCLEVRILKDMSWIGDLINLEFLTMSTVSLIDMPMEMGELINLRFLNFGKMNLAYIPPGVLSRMMKLEELYLPLSFRRWGYMNKEYDDHDDEDRFNGSPRKIDDGERINASLREIEFLPLTALQISVSNISMLPKRSPFFQNIRRFKILVSSNPKHQEFGNTLVNELQLVGDAHDIKEIGIWKLISLTKGLTLTRVRNLRNVMYQLGDDGFPQLKKMYITECDELDCLVDTTKRKFIGFRIFCELNSLHLSMLSNLKEIWRGARPGFLWFENLRQINIRFCHKLKYVFPLSMARGLTQLQSIEVLDCNEMEGIFCENEEDNTSEVYFIEELLLHSLPKLVGFLVQKDNTNFEIESNRAFDDGNFQSFPTNESTSRLDESYIDDDELISNNQVSCIKNNDILIDTEMYCAFSSQLMEKRLESLVKLKIAFCDALKVIFSFNQNHANSGVLNSLKELELYGLRNLMHIWFQVPLEITAFQNLQILILSECHNLYLLSPRVAVLLVQLQEVQISRCEKLENIVLEEDEKEVEAYPDKIVFPRLKTLEFQYMPNLGIFYSGASTVELPLLEFLKLNQCNKMKSFSRGSLSTPMLKKVEINERLHSLTGDLNATMKR